MFNEYEKKVAGRDSISAREYNLLQRMIRNLAKSMGVNAVMCGSGLHFRRLPKDDTNEIKRAKAQEGSQIDGEISVKLLDVNNAVVGSAFDVYAFPDRGATDMTDYLPEIDTNDVLHVSKANDGKWYLAWPTLTEVGVATSTVSLTATTLFGRVTNVYGKW